MAFPAVQVQTDLETVLRVLYIGAVCPRVSSVCAFMENKISVFSFVFFFVFEVENENVSER